MVLPTYFHQLEFNHLINLVHTYGVLIKPSTIKFNSQQGGANKEYKFDNYTFNVSISKQDGRIHIAVLTPKEDECVTIFIDNKEAIIHNMSYDKQCAKEGLKKPGGGDILMKFMLDFLKKNKDKLKIKRILLTDYSYLVCPGCDENIKLARLRMITHGETWYMKYGFKPYNTLKQQPDDVLLKGIDINKKIRNKLSVNQINIIKLAKEHKNIDMREIKRLIDKYVLIKDFIIRLSKEFSKYCYLIEYIMKQIYDPPLLEKRLMIDYYGKSLYLDI